MLWAQPQLAEARSRLPGERPSGFQINVGHPQPVIGLTPCQWSVHRFDKSVSRATRARPPTASVPSWDASALRASHRGPFQRFRRPVCPAAHTNHEQWDEIACVAPARHRRNSHHAQYPPCARTRRHLSRRCLTHRQRLAWPYDSGPTHALHEGTPSPLPV